MTYVNAASVSRPGLLTAFGEASVEFRTKPGFLSAWFRESMDTGT